MSQRILVIDDDPDTSEVVRSWFKDQPYEILAAENGETGLAMARELLPDLILLDLKMPGMDGISVARELKNDPQTRATPVLVLTTESGEDKKTQGKGAGATGWLVKPFDPDQLLAVVNRVLD